MGNKLISLTMIVIVILLIVTFGMFGFIIYDEFNQKNKTMLVSDVENAQPEVEDFEIVSSSESTISNEIETPQVVKNPWDTIEHNETAEVNDENEYDNVQIPSDRYFYEQLDEESKTIYKALEKNKENMKTGTYKIEFGDIFSDILNKDGSEKLGEYYQSAIEAFIYDNAEIFYLSPNKMYLEITQYSNDKFDVAINSQEGQNYLVDEFSNKEEINSAINEIKSAKNTIMRKITGDTINDIKMVHDYLVDTIEYDSSISEPNIYDVYGALVKHVAVCEGYARAFKYIMDEMNIPCVLVMGKATNSQGQTENHAWNYVQLDGKWYAIDVTWDDPIVVGEGILNMSTKYQYYLKGSNAMNQNHTPNGQFTENGKKFTYPELSMKDI